jgi:hypothetical protein
LLQKEQDKTQVYNQALSTLEFNQDLCKTQKPKRETWTRTHSPVKFLDLPDEEEEIQQLMGTIVVNEEAFKFT